MDPVSSPSPVSGHARTTPLRVVLPVSIGTGLSLMGDASLYAVLPTHVDDAGITLASVGVVLSVNRFIRLLLNGPAGMAYDRWPRRPLFVAALFIGAFSTATYALAGGFGSLLAGRLIWGLSWAGIWVGGNTIVVDVSKPSTRGRWIGIYNISFFLGTSSGSVVGGLLTDWLGYRPAMWVGSVLTLAGAFVALLFLPETSHLRQEKHRRDLPDPIPPRPGRASRMELISSNALMGVNRLTVAGILSPTLGLLLMEVLGDSIRVGGRSLGVASVTGLGLGTMHLVSMAAAPLMGRLSDRFASRWRTVMWGLLPGTVGFMLLAVGHPVAILPAIPLIAFGAGSNQSLSTAIVGELSGIRHRGRSMGLLFTIGDFTSAVGPLIAYASIPFMGLKAVYLICAVMLASMIPVALRWSAHRGQRNPC